MHNFITDRNVGSPTTMSEQAPLQGSESTLGTGLYVIPEPEADKTRFSTSYLHRVCRQVRSEILQYNQAPRGEPKTLDDFHINPLSGHCYDSARELSFTLYQAGIPHRVVKGGIRPQLEQYDELTEPYDMDDIEAIGARHYWIEVDSPDDDDDTTWVLELCSENLNDDIYGDIYVDTEPHDCMVRLDEHTDKEPWTHDSDWYWNTKTLERASTFE